MSNELLTVLPDTTGRYWAVEHRAETYDLFRPATDEEIALWKKDHPGFESICGSTG